jgi:hypothetical protein
MLLWETYAGFDIVTLHHAPIQGAKVAILPVGRIVVEAVAVVRTTHNNGDGEQRQQTENSHIDGDMSYGIEQIVQTSLQSQTQLMEMNGCKLPHNDMIQHTQRTRQSVFVLSLVCAKAGTHDPNYIANVLGHDFGHDSNPIQRRTSTLDETGQLLSERKFSENNNTAADRTAHGVAYFAGVQSISVNRCNLEVSLTPLLLHGLGDNGMHFGRCNNSIRLTQEKFQQLFLLLGNDVGNRCLLRP